jgi:hypothetical protein
VSAYRRKLTRYAAVQDKMEKAGVRFRPLVWTAEGRPHAETDRVISHVAKVASTGFKFESLITRWKHEVGVTLARRRAAMARASMPRMDKELERLLLGIGGDSDTDPDMVFPSLDDSYHTEEGDHEEIGVGQAG